MSATIFNLYTVMNFLKKLALRLLLSLLTTLLLAACNPQDKSKIMFDDKVNVNLIWRQGKYKFCLMLRK